MSICQLPLNLNRQKLYQNCLVPKELERIEVRNVSEIFVVGIFLKFEYAKTIEN